jgi:DNA polymerase III alpha subunit
MAVFMLDDVGGAVETVVFPETFGKHGHLIEADAMLLVRGKFEKDDESARLVASELLPVAALKERTTREVAIHLAVPPHGRPTFEAVAELLTRHRGDRRVSLEARRPRNGQAAAGLRRHRPARQAVGAARRRTRADLRSRNGGVEITCRAARAPAWIRNLCPQPTCSSSKNRLASC